MCIVDEEKAFDRVPRRVVEWALRKEVISQVLVRSVMWMHQCSVLSPFLFAVVVDVVTEFASNGALSELLYAGDLVLMSETI